MRSQRFASLATVAPAAPLGPTIMPAVADSGDLEADPRAGRRPRPLEPGLPVWPRNRNWGGGRNWAGGRNWNGGRNWAGRNWDNGRGYRHYRGGYGRRYNGWGGSGFALGLGLGIPLGYYGGGYYNNYYDGYYDEPIYRPRVIQRRVYRAGGRACRMVLRPLSLVPGLGQHASSRTTGRVSSAIRPIADLPRLP